VTFPAKYTYFKDQDVASFLKKQLTVIDSVNLEFDLLADILSGDGSDDEITMLAESISKLQNLQKPIEEYLVSILDEPTQQNYIDIILSKQILIQELA